MKRVRERLLLPVIAGYLFLAGSAPYLGQWDSFDYLKQIVSYEFSALGVGRPVYISYNIVLWETMRHIFGLDVLKVEAVAMAGTLLLGITGVIIFRKLASCFLPPSGAAMAAMALAISPIYAIYSGFIMTEIPMLVALLASALILWKDGDRRPVLSAVLGGILFGAAVGIREQALTLGAGFLWILCARRQFRSSRIRDTIVFCCAAGAVILSPVVGFLLFDPAGFSERIRVWLHAIPMGQIQFWNNAQASLLYTLAACPGTWLAVTGAGIAAVISRRRGPMSWREPTDGEIPYPVWGIVCWIVLPIVVLWRDADVQIHPRYLMPVLPPAVIMCTSLYQRWCRTRRAAVVWGVVHVLVFGVALLALAPLRQVQVEKMEFAGKVRDFIPGEGLIVAGGYSSMLDYYRGVGDRPGWRILWSGWDWKPDKAEAAIREAWAKGLPVYVSEEPLGWRYFENEYLHLYSFLKNHGRVRIAPHVFQVYP